MTSQFNRFTRGGTALVIDRNRTNGTMPCPSPHSVASDDNCQGVGHLRAPTPLERFGNLFFQFIDSSVCVEVLGWCWAGRKDIVLGFRARLSLVVEH